MSTSTISKYNEARKELRAAGAVVGGGTAAIAGALDLARDLRKTGGGSLNGLLANRLLSKLPAEEFERLLPHLEPISLAAGEDIYREKEGVRFFYFPETAVISHLHVLADGGTTEASMIGCEGVVGLSVLLNSPRPAHWTEVIVGGNALRIRTDALRQEFARGRALHQSLLSYLGTRIRQLAQRAICAGNHRVDARLCLWLLMVLDRCGEEQLSLTHEQIARHLGTRRAGITEAANLLRARGIIDYSRGQIRLLDRELLESSACECYLTLKERFDRPVSVS